MFLSQSATTAVREAVFKVATPEIAKCHTVLHSTSHTDVPVFVFFFTHHCCAFVGTAVEELLGLINDASVSLEPFGLLISFCLQPISL